MSTTNCKLISFIAVSLAVLTLTGGCSTKPVSIDDTQPQESQQYQTEDNDRLVDESEFRMTFQLNGLEADPPKSLEELVNRANLIVTGKIRLIEMGPVDVSLDEVGPSIQNVSVVVDVNDVLKGSLAEKVAKIAMVPSIPIEDSINIKPSSNQMMFFLKPRLEGDGDGYYVGVSHAGVVEETPHGLETVRDTTQSELVTYSDDKYLETFNDLVGEVRFLAK